jgi:asparagine synthase (glutamine-hydrolysing)
MVQLQDEPIADPVCVPVYYVSKLARENGVVVCQVGEGSDELFWGYPSWKTALHLQQWNDIPIPNFIKKTGLTMLKTIGKDRGFPYEWLRRGSEKQPIFWGGAEAFTDCHKKKLLSPRLRAQFQNRTSWEILQPIRERFEKKAHEKSHLNWMSYIDLNLRLPELLLMRVDKMSMGVSLEARVPFLDHKFVEYAMSIPTSIKIKDGNLKNILKKSVRDVIPDNIIDRNKQGFGVPIYEWLFEKLGSQIRNELYNFCDKTDYFNKDEVIKLINSNKSHQVWYLFNFALWWKEFIE